jgi:hypothetical protein
MRMVLRDENSGFTDFRNREGALTTEAQRHRVSKKGKIG